VEILRVIPRSLGDLLRVAETIAADAARPCGADDAPSSGSTATSCGGSRLSLLL
jgi:hypothetical protein